jgi:hypothetical protein
VSLPRRPTLNAATVLALGRTGLGGEALSFGRTVFILSVAESPLRTVLPVQFLNRMLYER